MADRLPAVAKVGQIRNIYFEQEWHVWGSSCRGVDCNVERFSEKSTHLVNISEVSGLFTSPTHSDDK